MKQVRSILSGLLAAVLLCLPAAASASDTTLAIIRFFDGGEQTKQAMLQALESEKAKGAINPELIAWVVGHFDTHEMERRVGNVLDKKLSPSDLAAWSGFLASPAGTDMARIMAAHKPPEATNAAINALPPAEQAASNQFVSSAAVSDTLAAIKSAEVQQEGAQYGQQLTCDFYAQQHKELLPQIQKAGQCVGSGQR